MRRLILLVSILVLNSTPGLASIWTVEKDGSGDYTIIQDAVDAAASGDTIRIGLGRFTDQRPTPCTTDIDSVRIYVPHDVLTIIGSGPEETIVGPVEAWDLTKRDHVGILAHPYCGNNIINVSGIRFENMGYALYIGPGPKSIIQDCAFAGNWKAIDVESDTTLISDCLFDGMVRDGFFVISYHQDFIQMDNCTSSAPTPSDQPWPQEHIHFQGTQVGKINNCSFNDGYGAFTLSGAVHVTAQNCIFSGQREYGIVLTQNGPPKMTLNDCFFSDQKLAFKQSGGFGRWEIEGTTVTDVSRATMGFGHTGESYIRNSILAKGEQYVVLHFPLPTEKSDQDVHLDMTDNWWGTADPDSIQAWIFDGNDNPDSGYIIDWQPYKGQPVATEKKSMGSLRALFKDKAK